MLGFFAGAQPDIRLAAQRAWHAAHGRARRGSVKQRSKASRTVAVSTRSCQFRPPGSPARQKEDLPLRRCQSMTPDRWVRTLASGSVNSLLGQRNFGM